MTEKELDALVQIAKKNLLCMEGRDDLEQHFSDEEDFPRSIRLGGEKSSVGSVQFG